MRYATLWLGLTFGVFGWCGEPSPATPEKTAEKKAEDEAKHVTVMKDLIEQVKALRIQFDLGITPNDIYEEMVKKHRKPSTDKTLYFLTLDEMMMALPEEKLRAAISSALAKMKSEFDAEKKRQDALKRDIDSQTPKRDK